MSEGPDGPEGELARLQSSLAEAQDRQMHAPAGSSEFDEARDTVLFLQEELARLLNGSEKPTFYTALEP